MPRDQRISFASGEIQTGAHWAMRGLPRAPGAVGFAGRVHFVL